VDCLFIVPQSRQDRNYIIADILAFEQPVSVGAAQGAPMRSAGSPTYMLAEGRVLENPRRSGRPRGFPKGKVLGRSTLFTCRDTMQY
jgi:hypothetical protein